MVPKSSGTHRYRSGTEIPSTHRVFRQAWYQNPQELIATDLGRKSLQLTACSGRHGTKILRNSSLQIWDGNPFNSPRVQAGMGPKSSGTHRYRSGTEIPSTHRVFRQTWDQNPQELIATDLGRKSLQLTACSGRHGTKILRNSSLQIWDGNPFNSPRVQAGMGPKSSGTHRYRSGTEIPSTHRVFRQTWYQNPQELIATDLGRKSLQLTACSGRHGTKILRNSSLQIWDGNPSTHCVFKHGPRSLVACRLFRLVVEGYVHGTYLHTNSKHWFTTSFLQGRCRKAMLGV